MARFVPITRNGAVIAFCFAVVLMSALPSRVAAAPEGQMNFAAHVTLAPRWLDPAETESAITPFMVLYGIHDALVKPMPSGLTTPSLAESWTMSKDNLSYEFLLRGNIKFHNGDPVTADDVKFSFERYHGGAAKLLKERVKEVRVIDPRRVRFVLKEPWPDFLTFYGTTATGAGWIVPKKYVEKVGDAGFQKAPIGAGPYRFVSVNPGIELVLEAFEGYWRKVPSVKRVVLKSVPDETTRAAALKRGEVDVAYFLNGPIAEDVRRTAGLKLMAVRDPAHPPRARGLRAHLGERLHPRGGLAGGGAGPEPDPRLPLRRSSGGSAPQEVAAGRQRPVQIATPTRSAACRRRSSAVASGAARDAASARYTQS